MNKLIKIAIVAAVLSTLTACSGHIDNKAKTVAMTIGSPLPFLFLK